MRSFSLRSRVPAFATVALLGCSYDFHQFAGPATDNPSGTMAGGGATAVGGGGAGPAGAGSDSSTTTGPGGSEAAGAGGATGSSSGGASGSSSGGANSSGGGGAGSSGGQDAAVDAGRTNDASSEVATQREAASDAQPNPSDAAGDVAMPGPPDASAPVDSGCGTPCIQCVDSSECSCAAYNGHEYRFCTTARTFADSKIQCGSVSMRL